MAISKRERHLQMAALEDIAMSARADRTRLIAKADALIAKAERCEEAALKAERGLIELAPPSRAAFADVNDVGARCANCLDESAGDCPRCFAATGTGCDHGSICDECANDLAQQPVGNGQKETT